MLLLTYIHVIDVCETTPLYEGVGKVQLETLISSLLFKHVIGEQNQTILGIHNDSRKIKDGYLFVCTKGAKEDGHRYIPQAIEQGAKAILIEDDQAEYVDGITYVKVPDTAKAASILVDKFFDSPSRKMNLIGVTGTNGKTTTTNLIEYLLQYKQYRAGVIGTIEIRYPNFQEDAALTTPLCYDLQQYLFNMVNEKVDYVAMEVSSHSLHLGRIHGCAFKTAVFTNLTQDHLDYHGTMEAYGEAKGLLFSQLGNSYEQTKFAILNSDDPWSERYKHMTSAQVITYGIEKQADIYATDIIIDVTGTSFNLVTPLGETPIKTSLIGRFNVYNLLAAIATVIAEGFTLAEIADACNALVGVEGRFEAVTEGQPFAVVVDYAHTPDSLENVLQTARQLKPNRVLAVVGCGGDRDRTKRPLMANIAIELADHAYFTSDNPRTEDPVTILDDMTSHLTASSKFETIVNRQEAIEKAISDAEANDIIIIAGKGHEKYQIIGTVKTYFDDKQVARDQLHKLGYGVTQ